MDKQRENPRFAFIDALRGFAALGVLFYHLFHSMTGLEQTLNSVFPKALTSAFSLGAQGVQVFFVISGFVIAHSLRKIRASGKEIMNFMCRRQVRLDLPYWAMIAIGLALGPVLGAEHGGGQGIKVGDLLLNFFYLQHMVGAAEVVKVGWTLCLEIQFYVLFILCLALSRLGRGSGSRPNPSMISVGAVYGLGILSLCFSRDQWVFGAWFLPFWCYFAAGALCYWAVERRISPSVFWSFMVLFAAVTPWSQKRCMIAGLLVILTLYSVGRAGHLTDWLAQKPFKYFGKISYSLYLVHLPVVALVFGYGYRKTGSAVLPALGWLLVAGATSILLAHLLHLAIEAPSMRLASRLTAHRPEPLPVPRREVALS